MCTGKEITRAGGRVIQAGKGTIRAVYVSHTWTNFEIQKYYQNKPKFNGVHSRKNLAKIKDGLYIINPDEYKSIGTHWIALYLKGDNVTYFDSFRVEYTQKEI